MLYPYSFRASSFLDAHSVIETEVQGAESNHRKAFKASVHDISANTSLAKVGSLAKPKINGEKYSTYFDGKCYKFMWQKVRAHYFITGRVQTLGEML